MRVCIICCEYPPHPHGGIGSFTCDLATGLVEAGHEVVVVGIYNGVAADEMQNGVRVVRLPQVSNRWGYRVGSMLNRVRLWRAIRAFGSFDLVEVPDYEGWFPYRLPLAGAKLLVRLHGSNLFFDDEMDRNGCGVEHRFERWTMGNADAVVAVSDYICSRTKEIVLALGEDRRVISCAVDVDLFAPKPHREESGLIVFANSLSRKKGIVELMKAMNIVCKAFPTARLVVLGRLRSEIGEGDALVERLLVSVEPQFHERITFFGNADRKTEVVDWLQRASICCYPSHAETFGIAPLESMAVGNATVFMQHGPGPEVIEDGVSGLLCDTRSPEPIADALVTLLSDAELRSRLGDAARRRVVEKFNKADWIDRNVATYREVYNR